MMIDPKDSQEDARESGEFKVHYHLNGGVHRMDAVVRNRAEGELLALLKEVGAVLPFDEKKDCSTSFQLLQNTSYGFKD